MLLEPPPARPPRTSRPPALGPRAKSEPADLRRETAKSTDGPRRHACWRCAARGAVIMFRHESRQFEAFQPQIDGRCATEHGMLGPATARAPAAASGAPSPSRAAPDRDGHQDQNTPARHVPLSRLPIGSPCHASRSRRPLAERGRARRCFPSLLAAGRAMPCFPAGSYHALQWDQGWSHCSATLNGTAPCGEARHGPAGRTQEAAPDRRDRGRNPVIRSKCARADIQRRFAACSEAWHGPAARPRPTAPRTSRTESESK